MQLTHRLCGTMIWLGKKAESIEQGVEISKKMIESGKAWEKFVQIVKRQQGSVDMIQKPENYPQSKFSYELKADKNGFIKSINALEMGLASVALGAGRLKWEDPIDPKAGIILHKKCGDKVNKDESILTLLTDKNDVIPEVNKKLRDAFIISDIRPETENVIFAYLDKSNLA